jgi:hypothetical protein
MVQAMRAIHPPPPPRGRKRYTLTNDEKVWTVQTMRRLAHRNKEYIVQLVRRYKTANGNRDPVLMHGPYKEHIGTGIVKLMWR